AGRPGRTVATAADGSVDDAEAPGSTRPLPAVGHDDDLPEAAESAFFSGTPEGEERSRAFAGPGQDVIEERERTAEHETVPDETPDHDTGGGRARG
ncbi:hypothetical protein G8C60_19440, partial [Cellulosimicrobium cellulans]|nr:hypothetical protein [Cellulosimicrobium cellulans]